MRANKAKTMRAKKARDQAKKARKAKKATTMRAKKARDQAKKARKTKKARTKRAKKAKKAKKAINQAKKAINQAKRAKIGVQPVICIGNPNLKTRGETSLGGWYYDDNNDYSHICYTIESYYGIVFA